MFSSVHNLFWVFGSVHNLLWTLVLYCSLAIGVARIFDWGGPKPSKIRLSSPKLRVWAEIGNSNDFSAQNQVISKKRSSRKLRVVFQPKPLALLLLYCLITVRGGVLEDVLGLEDVLEDRFWSPWPWPWPRRSSPWPWPWPRGLKSSKIGLSSARGQHYFLES